MWTAIPKYPLNLDVQDFHGLNLSGLKPTNITFSNIISNKYHLLIIIGGNKHFNWTVVTLDSVPQKTFNLLKTRASFSVISLQLQK